MSLSDPINASKNLSTSGEPCLGTNILSKTERRNLVAFGSKIKTHCMAVLDNYLTLLRP